ncbi:MAG: DUF1186 domain-containing protein [Lachnospiraceae bacterium]|nr:DUF1186 domain-containing protein [Lachnospiraceae bacterium]
MELNEAIAYLSSDKVSKISDELLDCIRNNAAEASDIFLSSLDGLIDTLENGGSPCNEPVITFFAPFFLADLSEKKAFQRIIRLLKLHGENLDPWLGDAQTENLQHIMYAVFDGDIDALNDIAADRNINEYTRSCILDIFGELYTDGTIDGQQFDDYMFRFMDLKEQDETISSSAMILSAKMHRKTFLKNIRAAYEEGWDDTFFSGSFSEIIDYLYAYDNRERLIRTPFSLEKELGYWFPVGTKKKSSMKEFEEKLLHDPSVIDKNLYDVFTGGVDYRNVQRNDPCPCGSGKKYKKCCLRKIEEEERKGRVYESPKQIANIMMFYPELSFDPLTGEDISGFEKKEDRIYLEDDYDRDVITIDYLAYLGVLQRAPLLLTDKNRRNESYRCRIQYLSVAFDLLKKKIAAESMDLKQYDERFSIHFYCREWLYKFHEILDRIGSTEIKSEKLQHDIELFLDELAGLSDSSVSIP